MENLISKELLSEVLNKKVVEICNTYDTLINDNFIDTEKELAFKYKCNNASILNDTINIYELSHKCKEWANQKGFTIWSCASGKECYIDGKIFTNGENIRFLDNSESESIFKVCEYIRKELLK